MKILVTGTAGQVVRSLAERAAQLPDVQLNAIGRPQLDLFDRKSVIASLLAAKPDVVVSAAAYTAVDRAEDEPEQAFAVNVAGASAVAEAANLIGAPVIHLSTDYVFAGDDPKPYREQAETGPKTVYGMTKREGERAVAQSNPRHVILRTSWVYSPFGKNFVRTMLTLARDLDAIPVVSDQWGNPTSALDLADGILQIASNLGSGQFGIYHLAGAGDTNWADFARHVFAVSRTHGGPYADVTDVSTSEYPAKARRPASSRLCSEKASAVFGVQPRHWQTSTDTVVRRLLAQDFHNGG
jgi:dTDP-4-dehydrorhamnose reductase